MSNALPKWNEERTAHLAELVGDVTPVTVDTVKVAADNLETSTRSVASKLRKMGYEVESAVSAVTRAYTGVQEEALRAFVVGKSGQYTYAELAKAFEGGAFTAKSVQGKILSMELTEHVKPTPKVEAAKAYTDEEEAKFIEMANAGAFIEQIAEAMDKKVQSVRGKALSLLRAEKIASIPKQEISTAVEKVDALDNLGDVSGSTVGEIAEAIGKTARGVKTMLTKRGITAKDYDGAAKKAKASASAE